MISQGFFDPTKLGENLENGNIAMLQNRNIAI